MSRNLSPLPPSRIPRPVQPRPVQPRPAVKTLKPGPPNHRAYLSKRSPPLPPEGTCSYNRNGHPQPPAPKVPASSPVVVSSSVASTTAISTPREPTPLQAVFHSLIGIWAAHLDSRPDMRLVWLRFSCWGKHYFGGAVSDVRAEERAAIESFMMDGFRIIAERLQESWTEVGKLQEGADWCSVHTLLKLSTEATEECKSAEQESRMSNFEEGYEHGEGASNDDCQEENVDELQDFILNSLNCIVTNLEGLNSMLVRGRIFRV